MANDFQITFSLLALALTTTIVHAAPYSAEEANKHPCLSEVNWPGVFSKIEPMTRTEMPAEFNRLSPLYAGKWSGTSPPPEFCSVFFFTKLSGDGTFVAYYTNGAPYPQWFEGTGKVSLMGDRYTFTFTTKVSKPWVIDYATDGANLTGVRNESGKIGDHVATLLPVR